MLHQASAATLSTAVRICFVLVVAAVLICVAALIDAVLETRLGVFEVVAQIDTAFFGAVLGAVAAAGLIAAMSAGGDATETGRRRNQFLPGLDLRLTDPYLTGPDVKRVQAMLHVLQFPVQIDGVYDQDCDRAVRNFQDHAGLVCDGVVGPQTIDALSERIADLGRGQWVRKILAQNSQVLVFDNPLRLVAEAGAD